MVELLSTLKKILNSLKSKCGCLVYKLNGAGRAISVRDAFPYSYTESYQKQLISVLFCMFVNSENFQIKRNATNFEFSDVKSRLKSNYLSLPRENVLLHVLTKK